MGRPPYRLLRKDDRTRIKYIQQRYEKRSGARELTGGERKYLLGKRKEILNLMVDLTWFAEELPEDQLSQIFTEENIDKFTSTLLTQSRKKSRKTDPNRPAMMEREHCIAGMLMEKGLARCSEQLKVDTNNMELWHFITQEAYKLVLILTHPGRRRYVTALEDTYNPQRYRQD